MSPWGAELTSTAETDGGIKYISKYCFDGKLDSPFWAQTNGQLIYNQGVQPNFSEKCGNVGMAMKMWEFFFKCGNY